MQASAAIGPHSLWWCSLMWVGEAKNPFVCRASVWVPHYHRTVLCQRTLNVITFAGKELWWHDGVIAVGPAAPKRLAPRGHQKETTAQRF